MRIDPSSGESVLLLLMLIVLFMILIFFNDDDCCFRQPVKDCDDRSLKNESLQLQLKLLLFPFCFIVVQNFQGAASVDICHHQGTFVAFC